MATYSVERLSHPSSYLVRYTADFHGEEATLSVYQELSNLLDTEFEPISIIFDLSQLDITVNDLMVSSKILTQSKDLNPVNHPMAQQSILITNSSMIRLSIEGFRKFGGVVKDMRAVSSLDEALQLL